MFIFHNFKNHCILHGQVFVMDLQVTIALLSQQQKACPLVDSRIQDEDSGQPIRIAPARTGPVDDVSQSMLPIICIGGHVSCWDVRVGTGGKISRRWDVSGATALPWPLITEINW